LTFSEMLGVGAQGDDLVSPTDSLS